ncbi:FUN14 domain-containing protein [Xylocopilactobacillus apis]|uniref:FUN14 domain-containing protein n=1 Tax=Xylocopilactobacillus apis TaxID=2932183 RepID=UPI003CE4C8D8
MRNKDFPVVNVAAGYFFSLSKLYLPFMGFLFWLVRLLSSTKGVKINWKTIQLQFQTCVRITDKNRS